MFKSNFPMSICFLLIRDNDAYLIPIILEIYKWQANMFVYYILRITKRYEIKKHKTSLSGNFSFCLENEIKLGK